MCTSLHWLIKRKAKKGDNFVMDLETLLKVNQVIYTLDTICDPNIITLAQITKSDSGCLQLRQNL